MRSHIKKKLILLILGSICGFSILINSNLIRYQGKISGNFKSDNEPELKKAGYWEIGPIEIDDNDPTKNWLITEATYDWCSGSGTLNDPYLIENVTIDGSGSMACIRIQDSNAYFEIRNCTLYNADDYGVFLPSANNGKLINNYFFNDGFGIQTTLSDNIHILNNTASFLQYSGIRMEGGSNTIIKGNVANNNQYGIEIINYYLNTEMNSNEIQNNTFNNNQYAGIRVYVDGGDCGFNNNKIFDNRANNNGDYGIQLYTHYGSCNYNEIKRNVINNNGDYGIYLYHDHSSIGSCRNNEITGNKIINNSQNGINLKGWTDNNEITDNTITNNTLYGALIDTYSHSNIIYNNTFKGNTVNSLDSGSGNQWNHDFIQLGNYWGDYTGFDMNDDGIGDAPYDVPPVGGSVDSFPIWEDGDDLGPYIVLNSPSMNDAFGVSAPTFDITISDDSPINTTWYTIDSGTTNYTFSGLTGTVNQTAWDNKGTDIIILILYANDSLGHVGFEDVTIWKDLVAPRITINSPALSQLCGVDAPTFSLTINEPNIQTKLYSINGRPNNTFTIQTQFSQSEWNTAGNGTVSITFYVIDKVGNTNSSEVIVRKDAYIPDITIHSPVQDGLFGSNPPEFNITIIEEDLVSMWYVVEGNLTQHPFTGESGTISQEAWNYAIEGDVIITFYAQDRAGNIGTGSVVVRKSIPSPPAIPGYNLFVLFCILSVAVIIIERKRRILIKEF